MKKFKFPDTLLCGYFDCSVFAGLTVSPERVRTLFEIEYYLSDGLTTYTDGKAYPIRRAHVLIGKPGERCNSLLPFQTKYLKFDADGPLADLLNLLPKFFPIRHTEKIESLLDTVIEASAESSPLSEIRLGAAFCSLIELLCEDAERTAIADDPTEKAIQKAKQFVREHFGEPIKLSDIAASAALSPSYFHALFTASVGVTPHDYLQACRIASAQELLCMTSLSISEIAERCGFINQQYLGTVFRQKTGVSPAKYRKAYRQKYLV